MFLPPSEQLLAFTKVVDLGSFTAAATELSLTQSAVSHQVAKLERSLGVKLLVRNARGVALTAAGEALFSSVREPLRNLVSAFEPWQPSREQRLEILVESFFASTWLSPRLERFFELYPSVRLTQRRVSNSGPAEFEGVDLAIKWGAGGEWPSLNAEMLMSVYSCPICSPQLVEQGKLRDISDILNQTLLHDRRQTEWHQWLRTAGLDTSVAHSGHLVDDTHILVNMVIRGGGVALGSPQLLRREIENGELVVPFPDVRLYLDEAYYILTHKQKSYSRCARGFVDWLKQEVRASEDGA